VKHGHRELFDVLATLGANLREKGADRKKLWDLTSDADWKRKIIEKTLQQEKIFRSALRQGRTGNRSFDILRMCVRRTYAKK
jgi:hypothetical protein